MDYKQKYFKYKKKYLDLQNLLGGTQQQKQQKTLDDVIRRFNEQVNSGKIELGEFTKEYFYRKFTKLSNINMNKLYNLLEEIDHIQWLNSELIMLEGQTQQTQQKHQQQQEQDLRRIIEQSLRTQKEEQELRRALELSKITQEEQQKRRKQQQIQQKQQEQEQILRRTIEQSLRTQKEEQDLRRALEQSLRTQKEQQKQYQQQVQQQDRSSHQEENSYDYLNTEENTQIVKNNISNMLTEIINYSLFTEEGLKSGMYHLYINPNKNKYASNALHEYIRNDDKEKIAIFSLTKQFAQIGYENHNLLYLIRKNFNNNENLYNFRTELRTQINDNNSFITIITEKLNVHKDSLIKFSEKNSKSIIDVLNDFIDVLDGNNYNDLFNIDLFYGVLEMFYNYSKLLSLNNLSNNTSLDINDDNIENYDLLFTDFSNLNNNDKKSLINTIKNELINFIIDIRERLKHIIKLLNNNINEPYPLDQMIDIRDNLDIININNLLENTQN